MDRHHSPATDSEVTKQELKNDQENIIDKKALLDGDATPNSINTFDKIVSKDTVEETDKPVVDNFKGLMFIVIAKL